MYISRDGWIQYSEVWSVRTLFNKTNRGEVNFDWEKQRGIVWANNKASLFIHSVFWGMLDNTETFRFTKHDKYFCTDGKQRGTAILRFINNEYKLSGLKNSFNIYLANGEIAKINGHNFSELPQELQDKLWDLQINVAILENADSAVESEMFARMNSGIAVTKSDIAIAKNASSGLIDSLGEHQIFKIMLTKKAIETKKYRAIVVRLHEAIFNTENMTFRAKHLLKAEENVEVTEETAEIMGQKFDFLLEVYKSLIMIPGNWNVQILMFNISILPYIFKYLDKFNGDYDTCAEWINQFVKKYIDKFRNCRYVQGEQGEKELIKENLKFTEDDIDRFLKGN